MNSAFTADWHLGAYRNGQVIDGFNSRLLDIRDRVTDIINYIKAIQITSLFVLGDLFRGKHPDMTDLKFFADILRILIDLDIDVVFIPGNHDVNRIRHTTHTLAPFKPLVKGTKVRIIDEPEIVEIGGFRFFAFPYMSAPQDAPLREFLQVHQAGKKDFVLLHGLIKGAQVSKLFEYEIPDDDAISVETLSGVRATFAGDIHHAQNFANVWYPGSVERLDFGDEFTIKGFLHANITDTELDVNTITLDARKMTTVSYQQLPLVEAGKVDVRNAIVRVIGVEKDHVTDVKRILTTAKCHSIASIQTLTQEVREMPKQGGVDTAGFVRQYAEKTGYNGDVDSASRTIVEMIGAES